MIEDVVQRYLEDRRPRAYPLRDAAGLLAAFGLTLLLLDADGLRAWASRMDVGPVQDFWLALVEPWQRAAAGVGLTAPRRLAVAQADRLAERFGQPADTSALLARGWVRAEAAREEAAPVPRRRPVVLPATSLGDLAAPPLEAEPPPAPLPGPREGEGRSPATVLLLGDSMMAANLASAIGRALEGDSRIQIVQAHREATGLSRPDIFDWPSVVPDLLAAHHPRIIVCTFGGNDAQRVRLTGRRVDYGGDGWDELYHGRVRAMMQALAGTDADVLWLGLPPMRAAGYDGRMKHLNTIFASEARELARVTYQETASAVAAEDGSFAAYLRGADGRLTRARLDDGVHYAAGGAQVVAGRVVDWIQARLGARTKTASLGR